jgi:hypothetical protein
MNEQEAKDAARKNAYDNALEMTAQLDKRDYKLIDLAVYIGWQSAMDYRQSKAEEASAVKREMEHWTPAQWEGR